MSGIQKIEESRTDEVEDATDNKNTPKVKNSEVSTAKADKKVPTEDTTTKSDESVSLADAQQAAAEAASDEKPKKGDKNKAPAFKSVAGFTAPTFTDKNAHRGGTYTFNDKGERVPVHEEYVDDDGETQTRPMA